MGMKMIFVLFVTVSATVLATSDAAQRARFVTVSAAQLGQTIYKDIPTKITFDEESQEVTVKRLNERILRMNTHDYGNYNPTPSLSKPRNKLIPN